MDSHSTLHLNPNLQGFQGVERRLFWALDCRVYAMESGRVFLGFRGLGLRV